MPLRAEDAFAARPSKSLAPTTVHARSRPTLTAGPSNLGPVADERCPYAHGALVVEGPLVDGKQGVDQHGRIYRKIMICPECKHFFAAAEMREIVEVEPL